MESPQEQAPVTEERRLAVAEFIQDRLGIALRVINSGHELDTMEPSDDFQARSYQLDALARLWDRRDSGQDKELLHLATGLGKTTVATLDMMKFQDECAQQSPPLLPRMLYVSHKNEINEQAEATVKRLMPDLETATFNTKQRKLPDADVTFATFQSLHSKLDRFDPQDYEYIVWDEGHHTKAETYMQVVEHFDPLHETAITATPNRADGKDIREYFGEEVYSKGLAEGIAEGWLADVNYNIVFDKAIKNAVADGFNPKTLKDIKDLFAEKPPAEAIANNIREEITKLGLEDPKTIIFCADIAEADEMAELLGGTAYHSDTKDRPQVLQDFRDGRRRVITTRDMFNEGVDIPDAELIVFLRSTRSNTIFEQQLGRGLRKATGKGKVHVLDFVANIERIAKVRELGQAIRQQAEEIGEGQLTEEGIILGGNQDEPGLRISSSHGKFDFDKIAVDLLEKWGELQSNIDMSMRGMSDDDILTLAEATLPDEAVSVALLAKLSAEHIFVSPDTIRQRFGSIGEFNILRGYSPRLSRFQGDSSQENILAILDEHFPGRAVTTQQINELRKKISFPSTSAIAKNFGGLRGLNAARGFGRSPNEALSKEQILEMADEVLPTKAMTAAEIDAASKDGAFVSSSAVVKYFGSINDFNLARGLTPNRQKSELVHLSNDDLVRISLEFKPGEKLTKRDIESLSKQNLFVSDTVIKKRFGSVQNFNDARAQSQPETKTSVNDMTNDELVALACSLKPGGSLAYREVEVFSKEKRFVSTATLKKRFGSLQAFQALCDEKRSKKS